MTDQHVALSIAAPIATITLCRPDKLNALTPVMLTQLESFTAQIEQDREVRVVLLKGDGRAFCVGADINAWTALAPLDMWRQWIRDGHRIFQRVADLPQPVIACLHGYAFGGGLELALAADLRIAADDALMAFPEVTIATVPGWGGAQRLPALIGAGRAKRMIFTGQRIDAATAERWGLVEEIVAADQLDVRAFDLAQTIAGNAPVAVQLAKQAIDRNPIALEAFAGALSATTQDAREGLASFLERRTPNYTGG